MPRAPKVCTEPGCVEDTAPGHARCPDHLREKRRLAPLSPTAKAGRSSAERRRRAAVVARWVRDHGYLCPGWQRPPHAATDLTAAHVTAVAHGTNDSRLEVLCRSCNSRQKTQSLDYR